MVVIWLVSHWILQDMVVLPYKDSLLLFSRYLQQLVMESLGKEFDLDGNRVCLVILKTQLTRVLFVYRWIEMKVNHLKDHSIL